MTRQNQLLERLKKFSLECLNYVHSLPKTEENRIYGHQLIKSSSSAPANYAESLCSLTRQDWIHDINKTRKELSESETWLDLLVRVNLTNPEGGKRLQKEANELVNLFSSSIKSARMRNLKNLKSEL